MARLRRPCILLGVGLVLIGGSILLVRRLTLPPDETRRIPFDLEMFDRGMREMMEEKSRCEDLINTALRRDRPHFEAIVKAVEKQGLAEDQSGRYSFPKGGAPDLLVKVEQGFDRMTLGEFCKDNTLVHAYRRGGVLFVKVVMCEMGHAGTYAVLYSSKELTEKEITDQLVPCAVNRLDPHWWAVVEWY